MPLLCGIKFIEIIECVFTKTLCTVQGGRMGKIGSSCIKTGFR